MANKQWVTEPLNSNDKLNTVYYSPKKNIAPIKKKKKKKKDFFETVGDVIEGTGKTILNTGIEIGKGAVDFSETILDAGLQLGSSKYNPYYMLHPEKLKSHQAIVKDLVKVDASQKAIDETLGYGKKLSTGKTIQQTVDEDSLIKSTNLGGKIARGIGEMLPSIMTGNTAQAAIVTGISGYGSGIETAYQGGASRSKANLYGLGSAAINSATEMITGGIPGVKTKWLSGLDKVAEKGISKVGNEIAKSLIRAGYKVVGEGGEEAIAEMLDPYLKNITYDKNAKIDWQNVIDSAVQGGITGGILNLPGTIGDVKTGIQTEKANTVQNKVNLPISSPIEQQTNKVDTNIPIANIFDKIQKDRPGLTIQSDKNIQVNGLYIKNADGTRTIITNPNSPKATEFVLIHELAHDLAGTNEYNTLKDTILNYDKKISGYDDARQNITNIYSDIYTKQILQTNPNISQEELNVELDKMIDEETTNDVLGTMLSDQDYINNLSTQQPNVFQKIYRWVNDMLKRVTGKETKFLQDIKNKFEKSYRQTNVSQEGTKYSQNNDLDKYIFDKEFYDNFKYENKNKISDTKQDIENKLKNENLDFDTRYELNTNLKALNSGYDNQYDYIVNREKERITNDYNSKSSTVLKQIENKKSKEINNKKLQKEISEATPFKRLQFEIIQKNNPMFDEEHVGIRSPKDIKTFQEVVGDEESFSWGDYTKEDALKDLKRNRVVIYSSYPIKQGVFVSTSKIQAEQYAGGVGERIYSKQIFPDKVAWINGDEGQYSEVPQSKIKYSKENKGSWEERLDNVYEPLGIKEKKQTFNVLPSKKDKVIPTKQESKTIETQPIESVPFNKQTGEVIEQQNIMPSKFTKTAMSSKIVSPEAKKYLKETFGDERASYVPIDDKTALDNADRTIKTSGYDNSKATFNTKINSGQRLSKNDIVLGERLIQEAIDRQDFDTAGELINNVAIAGSELGQAVQALSVIKKMTPQGQLKLIDTIINRENNSNKTLQKQGKEVKLSKESRDAILNAKDAKELQNSATKAIEELSQQVPATLGNSLRSWRYLAMLGNPKTHIRNIVSNVAMKGVSKVKNEQAKILETIFKPEERTKKFGKVPKEIKDFVKNDALEMKDRIQGQDKYDLKSQFNLDKKSFSDKTPIGKGLNKLSDFNSKFLGIEDWMFSSSAYKENMANYMNANNISPDSDPKLIEKSRAYAIKQAQEQTFTQFNEFANKISQFEKNNKVANLVVGAILPFKKTPLNIAKTGIEYSPIGLAKTLTKGVKDLKTGKIDSSKFIDDISKGITGSEILFLGGILASMGLLRGSGSKEDKENALQKGQGYQPYSLQIGDKSITLDWLSPAAMPLFTGVELYELSKEDSNFDLATAFEALSTTLDPLTSMSMLQGVNSTISSYDMDSPLGSIGAVGINSLQNYALQFFPTVGGQLARTMDDTRRSTIGSGTGIEKKVNTFVNKVKAKIPGLENTLEPYTDYFGREQVEKNINTRIVSNFISPAYINTIKTTPAEEEIQKLFTKTEETSILPSSSSKTFTVDGVKYNINSKDYTKFNKQDGGKTLEILNKTVKTDTYKNLSDEEKVKLIEDTYKYTMSLAKETYSEKNNIPYELPKSMATLKSLEEKGTDVGTYLSNKAYIDKISSEGESKKAEVVNHLIKQNLNDDELEALYKTAGYTTDLSSLKKVNIPLKEYLKLEAQNIEATTNSIGTKVLRKRKDNYISAVNKLNLTIPQKALLIKNEYSSYDKYNNEIIKYVNNSSMNLNEKKTYLIGLGFKIKNGKVSW